MSLDYSVQADAVIFDSVTLTTGFTDNRSVEQSVGGMSKVSLDIDYTANNSANILEFQIEHSTDGTNWHSLVIDDTNTESDITPRVWQVTDTNALNVILDIAYRFIRISVRENGQTGGAGTVSMKATYSGE